MTTGSALRNSCIFLGCLALSFFAVEVFFGSPSGLPFLYRFRKPLDWHGEVEQPTVAPPGDVTELARPEVALVVASQSTDNTSWLNDIFSHWAKYIYVTDDPHAHHNVPVNKGREGQVYLTYIIDNYDHLPEITLFRHAERYQWHSDDPLFDGQRLLSRLQLSYIRDKGYTNLRCGWILTCPSAVQPYDSGLTDKQEAEESNAAAHYKKAFQELFPDDQVPEEVGGPCCAQFAVTAERIRQRPKSDYERFRKWLTDTPLNDDLSGRIMEYSWHIVFGEPAVSCPLAGQCYCGLYGLCNLECEEDGDCHEQYAMPEYANMPDGWPDLGWDGEWRNVTQMRIEYDEKHPMAAQS